jgi:hypothetical protein
MRRSFPLALFACLLTSMVALPSRARGAAAFYGGIEIGSKGVKAVALPIDESGAPELIERLPLKAIDNVSLGDRGADGKFRPKAIDEVRTAVAGFYTYLSRELKIPPARLYVVASSSLLAADESKENVQALRKAVSEATGGTEELLQIDQATEVDLLIRGAIPRSHWDDAILIDVGSGTVKCGYHHPQRGIHVERNEVVATVIDGTIAYTKKIQAEMTKGGERGFAAFCDVASRLRGPEVVEKVADEINRKPGLINRKRIYLSGGAPWALLTLTNPIGSAKMSDLYVPVSLDDIRKFRDDLQRTGRVPPRDLSGQPEAIRRKAEEQVREVLDTFTPENLLAGCEVLLGFADALQCQQLNKEVYFTRSGVVAWIVGYVGQAR